MMIGAEFISGVKELVRDETVNNLHEFQELLQFKGRYSWNNTRTRNPNYELRIWLGIEDSAQNAQEEYRKHNLDIEPPKYIELAFCGVQGLVFVPSVLQLVLYNISVIDLSGKQKEGASYSFTSDMNYGPSDELPPRFICDCHSIYLVEYGAISAFDTFDAIWRNPEEVR